MHTIFNAYNDGEFIKLEGHEAELRFLSFLPHSILKGQDFDRIDCELWHLVHGESYSYCRPLVLDL